MDQEKKTLYAVDFPNVKNGKCTLPSPFGISGWLIPAAGSRLVKIAVIVNGRTRALAETGLRRADVAAAFPDRDNGLWSGFAAEVYADDLIGTAAAVELRAVFDTGETPLVQFEASFDRVIGVVSGRAKNWTLGDFLACPHCLSSLEETDRAFQCRGCQTRFEKRRGAPVFAGTDGIIQSQFLETNPTNPNGQEHTELIKRLADGIVLDFGAGNPRESEHFPNVVFHEFVQYAYTDVVSVTDRLPYRDNVFDAVISKAVFEHVARPWEVADELYRVLKPGGLVHVDTAFMQPQHGDPYHFFNMTLDGAKEIFKHFETVRCGVKSYQTPAYSLRMQIDVLLEHLRLPEWQQLFQDLRASITNEFDLALDRKGLERMAAGVFFEGRKPSDSHS